MKGFNIAPPGSTGSLAPVAEFSTSLDNFDQQHEILTSTLSNLFHPSTFMHKKATFCTSDSMESPPPINSLSTIGTVQTTNKYNKSTLKPYNKRIAGHKKKWGTLIEAAKVGNVSKMLGRSKSEDSVCNSSNNSSPVHGQVRVTYSQNCAPNYYNPNEVRHHNLTQNKDHLTPTTNIVPSVGVNVGTASTHFFHTTTGK